MCQDLGVYACYRSTYRYPSVSTGNNDLIACHLRLLVAMMCRFWRCQTAPDAFIDQLGNYAVC